MDQIKFVPSTYQLFRRMGALVLIVCFCNRHVFAQDLTTGLSLSKDLAMGRTGVGNEFVSGDYPGAVLMKVNLWGAVGKTGIHFVPTQTDLITLLSYAGGPSVNAKLNDVFIKRWTSGKEQIIRVDAEKLIQGVGKISPTLEANDVVVIPTKTPLISQDTSTLIGVITSIVSLLAVSLVLVKSK